MIIFLGHSRDWSAVWWFMAGMSEHWDITLASCDTPKGCLRTRDKSTWIQIYPTLDQAHTSFLLQISQPQDLRLLLMQATCRNVGRAKDLLILSPFLLPPPQIDVVAELGGEGCCWSRTKTTMFLFPLSQEMSEEINFSPIFPSLLSYPNYSTEALLWLKRLTSRYNYHLLQLTFASGLRVSAKRSKSELSLVLLCF